MTDQTKDRALADELLPCPFCGQSAAIITEGRRSPVYSARCDNAKCPVMPEIDGRWRPTVITAWNTRASSPDREAVRSEVAKLYCAAGCSCCRDDDAWYAAAASLAVLFDVPKYDDGSGYDWYSVRDAALKSTDPAKSGDDGEGSQP